MTAPDSPDEIRRAVRRAMLGHIPFDGWSRAAFDMAVADAGVDAVLARDAFPNGPADVLADAAAAGDAALLERMNPPEPRECPADRLTRAMALRLDHNAGREDAVRRGLTFLAAPGNAPLGMRLMMRTVDAVRTAAGDSATGLRGMARRNALASVYSAAMLVWLEDGSEAREVTRDFLARRLHPLTTAGSALEQGMAGAATIPRRMRAAAPGALPGPAVLDGEDGAAEP